MSLRSNRAQGAYATRDSDLSRAAHQSTELAEIASGKSDFLHGIPPSLDFFEAPLTAGIIGSITCVILSACMLHVDASIRNSFWYLGSLITSVGLCVSIWIGRRFQIDFAEFERLRERWEVENFPEGEIQEMVQIYTAYGVSEKDALSVANTLSKYKDFWVDHMLLHEIGIIPMGMRHLNASAFTDNIYSVLTFITSFILPSYSISASLNPWLAWTIALFQASCLLALKRHSNPWVSSSSSVLIVLTSILVSAVISKFSQYISYF
jgi:DNA damage-binding protein 1